MIKEHIRTIQSEQYTTNNIQKTLKIYQKNMTLNEKARTKQIGQGAEAIITQSITGVKKSRQSKAYRHPSIDSYLRKQRHQTEVSLLQFLKSKNVPVPKILSEDKDVFSFTMEFIKGTQLRDILTKENAKELGEKCGSVLSQIHSLKVSHGDVTTSNILVNEENELTFIDFGLATRQARIEDMAVDINVLEQTLDGHHAESKVEFLIGFFTTYGCEEIKLRLETVQLRGKNKAKKGKIKGD